jgi:hypothetical protein
MSESKRGPSNDDGADLESKLQKAVRDFQAELIILESKIGVGLSDIQFDRISHLHDIIARYHAQLAKLAQLRRWSSPSTPSSLLSSSTPSNIPSSDNDTRYERMVQTAADEKLARALDESERVNNTREIARKRESDQKQADERKRIDDEKASLALVAKFEAENKRLEAVRLAQDAESKRLARIAEEQKDERQRQENLVRMFEESKKALEEKAQQERLVQNAQIILVEQQRQRLLAAQRHSPTPIGGSHLFASVSPPPGFPGPSEQFIVPSFMGQNGGLFVQRPGLPPLPVRLSDRPGSQVQPRD